MAADRSPALLPPALSAAPSPANDARLALWGASTPTPRQDASPPARLTTGCARPRAAPERDAGRGPPRELARPGGPALTLDGSERRQRPHASANHQEHDSGTQKAPTDKHLLLVNANPKTVV